MAPFNSTLKRKLISNVNKLEARSSAIYPIESAEQLLAKPQRQRCIDTIRALLNLPKKIYANTYFPIIRQFAEFVQNLPGNQKGVFAYSGGFLDHGLERATHALTICLEHFFPGTTSFHRLSSQDALWIYALFTVALLLDVSLIPVKYQITLCNAVGHACQHWSPYTSTMNQEGEYYWFEYVKENRDELRRLVAPLLARQLLDRAAGISATNGFNWLATDPQVLEAWLMLLTSEDKRIPMSSFMTVMPLADMQTISNRLRSLKLAAVTPAGIFNPVDTEDLFTSKEQHTGVLFLNWLRKRLAEGVIVPNTAGATVHMTDAGVLLSVELFHEFIASHPQYKDPRVVERQFRALIEHYQMSRNEVGRRYSSIGGVARIAMEQWLLVHNPYLLFALGQLPTAYASLQVLTTICCNQSNLAAKSR